MTQIDSAPPMPTIAVPVLWPSGQTPVTEVAALRALYANLNGLKYSVHAWHAALLLYQTTSSPLPSIPRAVVNRWRFIACNECVLELYHLRSRLEKIQAVLLVKCLSIRSLVEVTKLRGARKKLEEYFPHMEAMRHATAHLGEIEAFPELHAADGQFALSGFLVPDRYSLNYKGELHALEITPLTLEKIGDVVVQFLDAFKPAAEELERQGHVE